MEIRLIMFVLATAITKHSYMHFKNVIKILEKDLKPFRLESAKIICRNLIGKSHYTYQHYILRGLCRFCDFSGAEAKF